MALTSRGELFVGGFFRTLGGVVQRHMGLVVTPCPATAQSGPAPCAAPTGPVTLTATDLPWTGSVFRSRATGFGAGAIGVSLLGLQGQNTPLTQVFVEAVPDCALQVAPIAVVLKFGLVGGAAEESLSIPADPTFAGIPLHHQFLQLGLDAQGALFISSSNALQMTTGSFGP